MKREITSDQVLVHFNPKFPTVLSTDASLNAVAGVLSHKFPDKSLRPIAFASRALSKCEKNYSTLEKEALAIIFSVTKLKQYLVGHSFVLRTDHKPLLSIFGENKGLPLMAAARMQRWAFILSGFNYHIQYIKGSTNEADSLSRFPHQENVDNDDEKSFIYHIKTNNSLSINFKDIARETRRDPVLSKVCDAVKLATLKTIKGDKFDTYVNKINELTVDQDCLLWGYRVVVPLKLRKHLLEELHDSHLGVVKTKALARSFMWWPKIDNDIENLMKQCIPCQELLSSPNKSALIPWKPENNVWSRIHIDFAGPIKGFQLLVVIDAHSKWVEVFKTKDTTSSFVISKLREIFCRFGIVNTVVSDNGRYFVSEEFTTFLKHNNIRHVLTAPGQPSTNGQVENFVKTLKKSLKANLRTAVETNFDLILNRFLMDYRMTKHCTTNESPAKLMLGRSIRTRFDFIKPPHIEENILASQESSQKNYPGKRDVEFKAGEKVYIRDFRNPNKASWSPATIRSQNGPRSYTCMFDSNNRIIKSTRIKLRVQLLATPALS